MECHQNNNQVSFGIHDILQNKINTNVKEGCTNEDFTLKIEKEKYRREVIVKGQNNNVEENDDEENDEELDNNGQEEQNNEEQILNDNNNNHNINNCDNDITSNEESKDLQKSNEKLNDLSRKKKSRTVFSRYQVEHLENTFKMKRYLSSTERGTIAESLSLSETQVGGRQFRIKNKFSLAVYFL